MTRSRSSVYLAVFGQEGVRRTVNIFDGGGSPLRPRLGRIVLAVTPKTELLYRRGWPTRQAVKMRSKSQSRQSALRHLIFMEYEEVGSGEEDDA